MLREIESVIFDFDGTLVDSMWLWRNIDIEYLGKYNIKCPNDLGKCIESLSFTQTAQYFKDRFKLNVKVEDIIAEWEDMAYQKYKFEVMPKLGVIEFIKKLKNEGKKIALATSNRLSMVETVLDRHDIKDYFNCIITSCDIGKGKYEPDIYLETAKRLDTLPKSCLVFEDIIAAIKSAKAAGMRVCAVEDEYSSHRKEEKISLADYFIDDYTVLL